MGTANSYKTDLYALFDYYQNTLVVHPKEIFIEVLRKFFSQDSYYHYSKDEWGFPNVVDHTDLPLDAGLNDDTTTRLYIGEYYKQDVAYYPSILVKHGGSRSKPISMSRNKGVVEHIAIRYLDGYGNETYISRPAYFVQSGAWEGTIHVDVETKSMRARDDLVELISISGVDTYYEDLYKSGIVIKSGSPSTSAPTEEEDRNDKIFKQTITFEIYSEWRRRIPINNLIDAINICVAFGNIEERPFNTAPNIDVVTSVDVIESYAST